MKIKIASPQRAAVKSMIYEKKSATKDDVNKWKNFALSLQKENMRLHDTNEEYKKTIEALKLKVKELSNVEYTKNIIKKLRDENKLLRDERKKQYLQIKGLSVCI